jgi:hypothetical protein
MKTKILFVFILLIFASSIKGNNRTQKLWVHQFTPMGSFKYSEMSTLKDSAMLPTIEFGFARVFGEKNDFGNWGILPMGYDWSYYAPYFSFEYRWAIEYGIPDGPIDIQKTIPHFMLNLGIMGGKGALITLFPIPLGLNGNFAFCSDFKDLFIKYSVSWDLDKVSIHVGNYINLTSRGPYPDYLSTSFIELRVLLWDVDY